MYNYVDDSELSNILSESRHIMGSIARKDMDSEDLLGRAKRMAKATRAYAGTEANPATHFIQSKANKVKNEIGMHIDMLRSTTANISKINEKINATGDKKLFVPDLREITKPELVERKLNEYNQQIDQTLKNLSAKTKGKSKIEQKIKKYQEIMANLEGDLKELPKGKDQGKLKKEVLNRKLEAKVEQKTEDLMRKVSSFKPNDRPPRLLNSSYSSEDEDGIGDWANYEGFNSQEDLDKYNAIFKEFVGESPGEYMRNHKGEEYDQLGMPAPKGQRGKFRMGLSKPISPEMRQADLIKKSDEAEKRLREVLGNDWEGSLLSQKRFVDKYLDKKLNDTIHTAEALPQKEVNKKNEKNPPGKNDNERSAVDLESSVSLDGSYDQPSEDIPKDNTKKSTKSKRFQNALKNLGFHSKADVDSKTYKELEEKSGEGEKPPELHSIQWDVDRIKKLILRERSDHLRKKREAWERNNELSDDLIDFEEQSRRGVTKPSPFEMPVPSTKPHPSDFLTDRAKYEKMYSEMVKGREGIFSKEDLDYEFGVNPFYNDLPSDKQSDGKNTVRIKKYTGVRKKNKT